MAPPPVAASPSASSPAVDDTTHRHLGFFFRADLGFGHLDASATVNGTSGGISGTSFDLVLAVGGAPVENLLVGGEVWGASTFTGERLRAGSTSIDAPRDLSLGLSGFGPTVTYYFMPLNLYVGATPGLGRLSVEDNQSEARTKLGFATRMFVGKEWWVGKHMGIGVSGSFLLGINPDEDESTTASGRTVTTKFYWTTLGGQLGLSMTYN